MTTKSKSKCKRCRRLRVSVCGSAKCALVKKPKPPGPPRKKYAGGGSSEYGKQLSEKQKLRATYGIGERQFRAYVENLIKREGSRVQDAGADLVWSLERRLDNVVYRMGFASTRNVARQLVSHGHFFVNGRRVTIPSYTLKVSDTVSVRPESKSAGAFRDVKKHAKSYTPPSWVQADPEKLEGKIESIPGVDDVGDIANLQMIFEFYAR